MLQAGDVYGWGCGMGSQWLWQSRDRRTNNPASSVLVIFNLYLLIPVSFVIRITLLLFRLLISIRGSNFKRCWRGLLVAVWGENIPSTRLDFSSGRKKQQLLPFHAISFTEYSNLWHSSTLSHTFVIIDLRFLDYLIKKQSLISLERARSWAGWNLCSWSSLLVLQRGSF